jgi:hypothetical protein
MRNFMGGETWQSIFTGYLESAGQLANAFAAGALYVGLSALSHFPPHQPSHLAT